jgi:outer membrane protein OmpA-like peptidoglycan-associated protein
LVPRLFAQVSEEKKPPTLAFHVFYNDFKSAQLMRTSSLKNMLDAGQWHKIGEMQMGFGVNYLKGITRSIDLITTLDASSTDYLYKDGSNNGSNKFLLDLNAGFNIKLFKDSHKLVPYFSGGAGLSFYKGKTGIYIPAGAGIQFNLFDEAFVLTSIQYRRALNLTVNDHFYYSLGIGTSISKKKKTKLPEEQIRVIEPVIVVAEVKLPVKNIMIKVSDEQTGLSLSSVEVVINGPDGKISSMSDANGLVIFNSVQASDFTVSGRLNGIETNVQTISKGSFYVAGQEITVSISHNDPRFTLAGRVNNKTTQVPEDNVTVSVINTTQNSTISQQNQLSDGTFSIPLEAAGDFTISGKKAGYISNIGKVSTKGLNRSTTLYVNLELEIEEAKVGQSIVLNNIYFEVGKAELNTSFSSDLEKLIQFLKDNSDTRLEIQGHTDNTGSLNLNNKLSQSRANSVVDYLTKNGIDRSQLIAKGYGPSLPVADNATAEGRTKNRRVVMKVIQ